jgi:O-antigen ligase
MESCKVVLAEQDSIAIRRVFYREAITMLFNRPVFGVGAGVFGNHSCLVSVGHAHSTILHVFAELGLVGGLPFLGFLLVSVVVLFRAFMHSEEQSKPILLGLIMLLGLHILVDQVQGNYFFSIGFYIFVGVAATIQSMRQQQLLALTRDSCE